MEKLDIYHTED